MVPSQHIGYTEMTNEDIVKKFRDGTVGNTLHLFSSGDKLYSYSTCIAEWYNNRVFLNNTKYSQTTSRHQNLVQSICNPLIITNTSIPRGTTTLDKYIE